MQKILVSHNYRNQTHTCCAARNSHHQTNTYSTLNQHQRDSTRTAQPQPQAARCGRVHQNTTHRYVRAVRPLKVVAEMLVIALLYRFLYCQAHGCWVQARNWGRG